MMANPVDKLEICKNAAMAGGLAVIDMPRNVKLETKADMYVGHHAVVGKADHASQEALLKVVMKDDPGAFFITEEHVENSDFRKHVIRSDNLMPLEENGAYIIDELDGTTSHNRGHYEWSVSVGFVDKRLQHTAGAIYAPEIKGGTLFYASAGTGSFVTSNGKVAKARVSETKEVKDAYILVGIDCFLGSRYPVHYKALTKFGDSVRTTNANGSCALALGLVAAGNVDALVQPLQSPWDWAAGRTIVEQAGGKFIFYEMEDGKILPIKKPELRDYNPDKRALGFVAGSTNIAEQVMDMLMEVNRGYG